MTATAGKAQDAPAIEEFRKSLLERPIIQLADFAEPTEEYLRSRAGAMLVGTIEHAEIGPVLPAGSMRLNCEDSEGNSKGQECTSTLDVTEVTFEVTVESVTPLGGPKTDVEPGVSRLLVAVGFSSNDRDAASAQAASERIVSAAPIGSRFVAFVTPGPDGTQQLVLPSAWAVESGLGTLSMLNVQPVPATSFLGTSTIDDLVGRFGGR